MKFLITLIIGMFVFSACSHLPGARVPSSVPRTFTPLGKGTRITLKQPVPFINAGDSNQTVSMTSRKKFSSNGVMYSCKISTKVPKQNTYFFQEGTTFDFKEDRADFDGNYRFQPKKGSTVNLKCLSDLNGEVKKNVFMEEVQIAFPSDVLVIERF